MFHIESWWIKGPTYIMCKRDTESVKMAPEMVLSNRRESRKYALDQVFAGEGYLRGFISRGLSPYTAKSAVIYCQFLSKIDLQNRSLYAS